MIELKVELEHMKEIVTKLREYLIERYGETMSSSLVGYRRNEMKHSQCDMCHEPLMHKESFRYVPVIPALVNYEELWICKSCAKREHGSKNKYKWKNLYEDLKRGVS